MPNESSLLRTGLTAWVAFIVLSVAWLLLGGLYTDGIVWGANGLLPSDLWLSRLGGTLSVRHVAGGEDYAHTIDSLVLHSGLLIVVALVAGTPERSWGWRTGAGVFIAAGFFLLQVVGMAVFAFMLRRTLTGAVLPGDVQIGFAIFWALTPLIVGGGFAYAFWLPVFRAPRREETGQGARRT